MDVWLTPRNLVEAVGPFDLDPCAAPEPRPWPTAAVHYTAPVQDGLALPWAGKVWLNPPFSDPAAWLERLARHGMGIALLRAVTETDAFFKHVWPKYSGILFLKGRPHFCYPDGTRAAGNAGAPIVMIGYGEEMLRRLANCPLEGHLVIASAAILLREDGKPVETWREVIERAMAGKPFRLKDLYAEIEATGKVRHAKAKGVDWKSKVRRKLQEKFQPVSRGVWAPA